MKISKKTIKKHKKTRKESGKGVSNKNDLEVIWEQVFPEDAERRIQRAFEMLLSNSPDFPS